MSHLQQLNFTEHCASRMESHYAGGRIVEIGSHSVNGEIRKFFNWASKYIGVDLSAGAGVDVVTSGHEFGESNAYDAAISCEVFEHNPYWLETFINMIRIVKPGGTVLFTCATLGRLEHGTSRTDPTHSPGTSSIGWNYYRNLSTKDFQGKIDFNRHFETYRFYSINSSKDLYFVGVKQFYGMSLLNQSNWLSSELKKLEIIVESLNAQSQITRVKKYPVVASIIESPLALAAIVLSDRMYQNFYLAYTRILNRIILYIRS